MNKAETPPQLDQTPRLIDPEVVENTGSPETENQVSPVLGMELINQAVEARDLLYHAQGPEERQIVFTANKQRWLNMARIFYNRQGEELVRGWADTNTQNTQNTQDVFVANSLDGVAIQFCFEAAALWGGEAKVDPEISGYSSDYYDRVQGVDIGSGDLDQLSSSTLAVNAQLMANSYAQDYLYGNPEIGPDSAWGEFLSPPGETGSGDTCEDLSRKLQANETLRQLFRQATANNKSPDYWKRFNGFSKGLLQSLSSAYQRSLDIYENQSVESVDSGRELARHVIIEEVVRRCDAEQEDICENSPFRRSGRLY